MKKFIHISGLAVLLLLAGCKNEDPGFPSSSGTDEEVGYIVTSGLSVSVADNEIISTATGESSPTKSATATRSMAVGIGSHATADSATTKASPSTTEASDDYKVTILNTKTSETMNYTYADLKRRRIKNSCGTRDLHHFSGITRLCQLHGRFELRELGYAGLCRIGHQKCDQSDGDNRQ